MPEPVKRSRLPGASELFRPTVKAVSARRKSRSSKEKADNEGPGIETLQNEAPDAEKPNDDRPENEAVSSGRVRHDEKITVYFSSDELIRLEDARLDLRRHHQLAVDRGRIVRAAVALALADLAEHGSESALYHHLQQ
ncbi:MAG: hypothetical protein Q3997_05175 [Propionibacteriaceae bacterium]|nr:hypothetical protein [Propionibacteriaceae bacterium]